jgi:hypothetical protein
MGSSLILMIFYATHDLALSFCFHVVLLQKVCEELTWKRLLANKYASTERINDFIIYSLFSYIIILAIHYTICTSQVIHERERGGYIVASEPLNGICYVDTKATEKFPNNLFSLKGIN